MEERTKENPLIALGAKPTGRMYISPCCTAGVDEFQMPDGTLMLIGSVAGHGFGQPWAGSVDDINETGTIVGHDGIERAVVWRPEKDELATLAADDRLAAQFSGGDA
jgi:hypothetical protein